MSDSNQDEKKQAALDYHVIGRPGKIEVVPSKPCITARDLSLAYTPGVAFPCLEIAENPEKAYQYTAKGNLVGVISNGTAVLGLGDIGPLAGKPVMEGKGILFKKFADIDVFDIEINASTVDEMVKVISALGPTFGGINLEDIKAPECFEVEQQLIEKLDIPVFHDDQHGTAIIASAAFLNALEVTKRDIAKTKIVFSGAGAAAMAIAKIFVKLGAKKENILMCDSNGVIHEGRTKGMNKYKDEFINKTSARTLADAMKGADAFMGCSARGLVSKEMVKSMGKNPIIFAMANPDPEIFPEEVEEVRSDAIMATGRSDYPNQVNNVLGFPFIFRGALDVRASKINEAMKLAAARALAALAKEEVPEEVKAAYGNQNFSFGKNYLIPKPFDKRVLTRVAPAVAKAAMESGVARNPIHDLNAYARSLDARLGNSAAFIRSLQDKINRAEKPRIVFAEGTNARILHAVSILREENFVEPILLGQPEIIREKLRKLDLEHLKDIKIVTPKNDPHFKNFCQSYYKQRQRKGVSESFAREQMSRENYFGSMMVLQGQADAMITGATQTYPECIKPIMRVVGTESGSKGAGIIILVFKNRILFLADCTVQIDPSAKDLSDIAISTAKFYRSLMHKEPRIAFLSFSNFGSNNHPQATKVKEAVEITHRVAPALIADGEIQADIAVNAAILRQVTGFSLLDQAADILIFPDLNASNICYKLLAQLSEAQAIGPVLVPMRKPVNIIQRTASVTEIVNMATLMALISQQKEAVVRTK